MQFFEEGWGLVLFSEMYQREQVFSRTDLCNVVIGRVMYQEFIVCNIAGNCITYAENSTIFYFKSVSTWQEEPTAHVRCA